jgi:hypothetical protein
VSFGRTVEGRGEFVKYPAPRAASKATKPFALTWKLVFGSPKCEKGKAIAVTGPMPSSFGEEKSTKVAGPPRIEVRLGGVVETA